MKKTSKQEKIISRRSVLPILGGSLLLPFLGFGINSVSETETIIDESESYQTLLKPDGTTVKVKTSTLKNAKVVKKNVSNKSLLHWIGKKF